MTEAILTLSLLLQIATAGFALRLLGITRGSTAWIAWPCIAAALLLMAVRRSISLFQSFAGMRSPDLQAELVALLISILMLVGVAAIRKVLLFLNRTEEIARLNREIATREAIYRGLLEQSYQFTGLMTTDGKLVDISQSALTAAGIDADEALNKPLWESAWWNHSPDLQERLKQAVQRAADGHLERFDADFQSADGSLIHIDFSLKPLRNDEGEVMFLISEGRDVTLLVSSHDRLKRLNDRLERANKELDEFAHIASHDLKSPLRAIGNLSTWIQEDAGDLLPPESAEHLDRIRERISGMDALLDDLLEYSKVGREQGKIERVDVKELVEEAVALVQMPAEFQIQIEDSLPTIDTLKTPLATCLRNLIDNAVKHHDRDDGIVQVTAEERGNFIDIAVADDGPGIDPRYHDRIFEIFQTLESKSRGKSSGVGLANVKKIAAKVGGDVRVESQEGEGAQFIISWPRTVENELPEELATVEEAQEAVEAPPA